MRLVVPLLLMFTSCGWAVQVSGKIVDQHDQGVPDASVWVWQDHEVKKTQTDDAGNFRFPNIPAKPANIIAYKPGCAIGGMAVPVPGIEPPKIILGEEAAFSLKVKNGAFEPVAGAGIEIVEINGNVAVPVADLAESGFPWPRSDDHGLLTFPGLPKDSYVQLTISHRDYANLHIP